MNLYIINFAGLIVIEMIVLWFWASKPKAIHTEGEAPIDIIVDGGVYTPARIEVDAGKAVTLRFLRKDPNPCAEKVMFDDLAIARDLPVGEAVEVTLNPEAGEYEFTCQMKMYRGALVVR